MYKLDTLGNGLKLITVPMQGIKTAAILVMVGTGSKHENRQNNGISHFLEHMIFKGTTKRPDTLMISSELDSVGGVYNAFTSKEFTGYWIKADSSKLDFAAEILSDIFINSKYEAKEIKLEKGVIIEEMNMYLDNPIMHIEDLFEACLYGDQPAGWDTIGTKENILGFSRKDFLDYVSSQYGAQNTVICIAGNVKEAQAKALTTKYFSKLKKSNFAEKVAVTEQQTAPQSLLKYKDTDQAHISLGVRAFGLGHKDEYIARALSVLLGGSMSSRLFIQLRERKGLAYYVHTNPEFYTDSGYITSQAGVPVGKVEDAIKVILKEYGRLKKNLVEKKELDKVKDLIKGRAIIQLEGADSMASWFSRQLVLREKIVTPQDFFRKIYAIRSADIMRVAKDIFTESNLNLAVIGPYKDGKKFDELLKI